MKKITFIHAADLHLDSPMVGLRHLPKSIFERLQESTFRSFSKIIDAALKHQVDFVILAGDLFDGEDRSIRAQTRFRKQINRLAEQEIPVYIVHGNHDHLDGKWTNMEMPPNAVVFPAEFAVKTFTKPDNTTVSLYGFSYPKKHVPERRIDDYIKKEGANFHIGILHGQFDGNSDHGRYAPFSLANLLDKQFDYWALGHIHKRFTLNEDPLVVYPGNIQGRHKNETGEKGCYLVTLTEATTNLEFVPTADCIWEEIEVDASEIVELDDLYTICRNRIDTIRRETEGVLVTITLKNVNVTDVQKNQLSNGELLETLQDEAKDEESSFVWPVDLLVEGSIHWSRESLIGEADFYEELFQAVDSFKTCDLCLSPLYQNSSARRFLNLLTDGEKQKLVQDAEDLLVQFLKNE